jgi:tetratricopeptide (TPR) repeat protein
MRLRLFPLLTLALVTLPLFAQAPDPAMADGLRELQQGRTSLQVQPLTQARDFFAQLAQKNPNDARADYELARADSYLIDAHLRNHDKKNAEHALDDAIAAVQKSISLNDKSADAHSLLADLYGRKTTLGGGMMAGARFGPKSAAENKKALALDDKDPRVYASLGRQYLHAPKMFGGDVDKAIESFQKATQLDPHNDEDYVWLAVAYRKKGDTAGADKALAEARRLNPDSVLAKDPPEK